jgi:hypothetical protein
MNNIVRAALDMKFDFDASWERASKIAEKVTDDKDTFDKLVKAMVLRDAAVVRMSKTTPMSKEWDKASFDIVQQECVLAPFGLV